MSVAGTRRNRAPAPARARHPNEFDRMRIARSLERRERYKYVSPAIVLVEDGYLVRSPCCSRTVDPDGGEIDIAWLDWNERSREWCLLRKDHAADCWIEESRYARLGELLTRLVVDPDKAFWQ